MTKAEELVKLLIEKNLKISFAESCTGGKLAAAIVDVADASKVFDVSFVTYANVAKMKYIGVQSETIEKYGVVSEQVAGEMAKGTALETGADVAVGISGIAGPTGGTDEKPVGMVCFGYYVNQKIVTETMQFGNVGRNKVRELSVENAIEKLIKLIRN